jgi:hypothetical protein
MWRSAIASAARNDGSLIMAALHSESVKWGHVFT